MKSTLRLCQLLLLIPTMIGLPSASAQTVFTEGNALADLPFNSDTGATNSQLTLDFSITRAGVLQKVLSWGESDGAQGGMSGVGESFQALVLRPLGSSNYLVAYETPYFTVANTGTNSFLVSGTPFSLQVGDVIAHYGRGIPFNNHNNGPSSVYIAANLPEPVVGQTITVPGSTYPVYNDGGRTYAIQVQVQQTFLVINNSDNSPGSLRQGIASNAAAGGGGIIIFDPSLSGGTIVLTSGVISVGYSVAIDASSLPGGLTISGGNASQILNVSFGTVSVTGVTFTGGNAINGAGGAIYNQYFLNLTNCTLSGNSADYGGAVQNNATMVMSHCTISGNTASSEGGAIMNSGNLTLSECTLANSRCVTFGGAIGNLKTIFLNGCTLAGNSASGGGGVYNLATASLTNSILAGNTGGTTPDFDEAGDSGITVTADHCLIGNGTSSTLANGVNGNIVGTSAAPINAQLATLGNYGGLTQTMPPLAGSPAIDAGGPTALTTDQRGFPRLSGAAVDVGAVEVDTNSIVTDNTDSGVAGSLRYAVTNVLSGDLISFATNLSGSTIVLTSGQIILSNNVSIDASGLAGGIAIDGHATSRIFEVTNATVLLNALMITNGSAPAASYPENSGGGILNRGTLTLNACALKNNQANGSGSGGGIENSGGTLTVSNCTFSENFGGFQGGGIDNFSYGTLTAINCTFSDDAADYGGGIENDYDSTASVAQCTIVSNRSVDTGGGLDNYNSTLSVTNCIVAGNTVGSGQDLTFESGVLTVGYCLIGDGSASTLANGANGNIVGTPAAPINARLAALGNYGGPTQTMPPLAGSPAINAGGPTTLTTDQRGHPRVSGAAVDIGAVEVDTNSIVTVNTDSGAAGSLRYAVTNVLSGDLISFATNLSGSTIVLTSGQIVLTNNVSLDGSGLPGGIQISGNHTSRAFSMGSNTTDTLTALTITNGVGSNPNYGGGVINYVSGSTLTLNRCTVSGNYASGSAGGLYSTGTTFVNECTFTGNSSGDGGGAGIYNDGTMTISQSTVSGNTSTTTSAGSGVATYFGTLTMNNSITAGNSAPSGQQFSYGSFTGVNNLTNGNPLLAPLGNYGGPTPTMPPLAGSPAIDAGAPTSFTTDQRGFPRVSGVAVDIGAVEVQFASAPYPVGGLTKLGNGSIQFGLTNAAGGSFTVFASTNAALPFNTWSNLGPALEIPPGSGQFQFNDASATNYPCRFYRVSSP